MKQKVCKYEKCIETKHKALGFCTKHYHKSRHSQQYVKKDKKYCSDCSNLVGHNSKVTLCRDCKYTKNLQAESIRSSNYYKNNKDKVARYRRERYQNDVEFKLSVILRSRLITSIKKNIKTGSAVDDLGCSIDYLKQWLESKFTEGMNWDNWGRGSDKWHVDHMVPLISFNLSNREEFKKACHYTNLQPLWEVDNLSKGSKHGTEA